MQQLFNLVEKLMLGAFSGAADSWFSLDASFRAMLAIVAFFCIIIYFIVDYFVAKVARLEKEKSAVSALLDKSEQKTEELGSQKSKISGMFLNFNEGVLIIDERNKIFLANLEAQRIIGVKTRELEGMHLSELKVLNGLRPIVASFSSSRDIEKKEVVVKDSFVEISVTNILLEDNKPGKVIIMRDVTKERLMDKAKNDFLLSAIHQLKTSMSSVRWLIKMFLDGDFGKLSKSQKEAVNNLYERNESIFPLITDMLNATKIDDGIYKYSKTSFSLEEAAESSVAFFKDKIKSKEINFKFDKPIKDIPYVRADRAKIETVMQNFLDNALKYTKERGDITVALRMAGKDAEFSVKDSGMGIPENQQPEIFSRFFRARNAVRLENTGSGLGLFIAKKIINDHNGRIWFESKEGEGSTFYFTLPT